MKRLTYKQFRERLDSEQIPDNATIVIEGNDGLNGCPLYVEDSNVRYRNGENIVFIG
jgi:hypothetical protein